MGDVYILNGKILSGLPNHAKDIIFDNTGTDLISTNSEDAIKEVNSNLTHQSVTITPAVGITLNWKSIVYSNKSLYGTISFANITLLSGSWVTIGNISAHPSHTIVIPAVNVNAGTVDITAKIGDNGDISVLSTTAYNNITIAFTFACETSN